MIGVGVGIGDPAGIGVFARELAELPPGPALGEMLASVDWSRYDSEDLFRFAELQAKQVAHEQARLLEVMLEATYAYGGEVKQEQRRVELFKQSLAKARPATVDGGGTDAVKGADSAADTDSVATLIPWPAVVVMGTMAGLVGRCGGGSWGSFQETRWR